MKLIKRLLNSKKSIYALIPVLANLLGDVAGFDITSHAMIIFDSGFGMLLISQTLLDFKWGSPSDRTGPRHR